MEFPVTNVKVLKDQGLGKRAGHTNVSYIAPQKMHLQLRPGIKMGDTDLKIKETSLSLPTAARLLLRYFPRRLDLLIQRQKTIYRQTKSCLLVRSGHWRSLWPGKHLYHTGILECELYLSFLFHRKSAELSDSSAATGGPSGGHLLPDGPVSIYGWWSENDQRLGFQSLKRDG